MSVSTRSTILLGRVSVIVSSSNNVGQSVIDEHEIELALPDDVELSLKNALSIADLSSAEVGKENPDVRIARRSLEIG